MLQRIQIFLFISVLLNSYSVKAQSDDLFMRQMGFSMNWGGVYVFDVYPALLIDVTKHGNGTLIGLYPRKFGWGLEYIDNRKKIEKLFINRIAINFNYYGFLYLKSSFTTATMNFAIGKEFYLKKNLKGIFIGTDLVYGKTYGFRKDSGKKTNEEDIVCASAFSGLKVDLNDRFQFRSTLNLFVGWHKKTTYTIFHTYSESGFRLSSYKLVSLEIHYKFK